MSGREGHVTSVVRWSDLPFRMGKVRKKFQVAVKSCWDGLPAGNPKSLPNKLAKRMLHLPEDFRFSIPDAGLKGDLATSFSGLFTHYVGWSTGIWLVSRNDVRNWLR